MIGVGVMIRQMYGDNSGAQALKSQLGQTIESAELRDDSIHISIGGQRFRIWDGGQSCCENRYMTTDDTLADLVGEVLTDVRIKAGPEQEDQYGELHEQEWLEFVTNGAGATIAMHNEHNGYYGGFHVCIEVVA